MTTVRLEFSVDWSDRKLDMMRRDVVRFFAQQGAPNAKWEVVGQAAPEAPKTLHLLCTNCRIPGAAKRFHKWESPVFTPCPKCGGRESVQKFEPPAPKIKKMPGAAA